MDSSIVSSPTERREQLKQEQLTADKEVSIMIINKVLGEKYTDFDSTIKSGIVLVQLYNKLYGTDLPIGEKENTYVYIDNHNAFMKATGTQYNAEDVVNGKGSFTLPYSLVKFVSTNEPTLLKEIVEGNDQLTLSSFLAPDHSDSAAALCSIILGMSGAEVTSNGINTMCEAAGLPETKWADVFVQFFKHQSVENLVNQFEAGGSAEPAAAAVAMDAAPEEDKKEKSEEEEVIGGFMMDSSSSEEESD